MKVRLKKLSEISEEDKDVYSQYFRKCVDFYIEQRVLEVVLKGPFMNGWNVYSVLDDINMDATSDKWFDELYDCDFSGIEKEFEL